MVKLLRAMICSWKKVLERQTAVGWLVAIVGWLADGLTMAELWQWEQEWWCKWRWRANHDVTTFDLMCLLKEEEIMKQTVVWLLGIGMGFLPQGNITVKISKSPPGRYLYIGIQQWI
jgi:hypothetical protein